MAGKIDKLTKGAKVSTGFIGSDGGIAITNLEVTNDKVVKLLGVDTVECTNVNTQKTRSYSTKTLISNHNSLVDAGHLD